MREELRRSIPGLQTTPLPTHLRSHSHPFQENIGKEIPIQVQAVLEYVNTQKTGW